MINTLTRTVSRNSTTQRDVTVVWAVVVQPEVVEAAIETLHVEAGRLIAQRRAVGLVEDAANGRRFVGRL